VHPIRTGHANVSDDQSRIQEQRCVIAGHAIISNRHFVTTRFERHAHQFARDVIVFDYQDFGHSSALNFLCLSSVFCMVSKR
jgi:hypothetical protein